MKVVVKLAKYNGRTSIVNGVSRYNRIKRMKQGDYSKETPEESTFKVHVGLVLSIMNV